MLFTIERNRYQPTNDNELTSKIREKIIKVMITNTDQSKNFLIKESFFLVFVQENRPNLLKRATYASSIA